MTLYFTRFVLFCADAVNDFMYKNCPHVAGAIAFYTMFSLFPLFLGVVSILGYALGPEAEQAELVQQIADVVPISKEFIENTNPLIGKMILRRTKRLELLFFSEFH